MVKPFWEDSYARRGDPDTFGGGKPSQEVIEIVERLPTGSKVLDLGCGDGRNTFLPAERGLRVTAIDISPAGIAKVKRLANDRGLTVNVAVSDMRYFIYQGSYDLIISHGCLGLIERNHWLPVIQAMKEHTNRQGYNIVSVFTDEVPSPPDLETFTPGLFKEQELFELYRDWRTILQNSRIFEDEHPGGIKHKHASNKIVAQKP